MKRIFLTLATTGTVALMAAFVLGWTIDNPALRDAAVQKHVAWHFLTAVGALVFAALVHAIVLTYFMGTGRWLEETTQAYSLPADRTAESRKLKYRVFPWMGVALVLLILTGGFGAVADPASPAGVEDFGGVSAATLHLLAASVMVSVNVLVNLLEYSAIVRNSELVESVLRDVYRIRREKGLPVE